MAPTQLSRNLSIDTPLGADVLLVNSIAFRDQLSQPFQLAAELISTKLDIDFNKVLGYNVTVRLGDASGTQRYFNGYVSRFVQTQIDAGYARYRMTIVPWLWLLSRRADCRIFQKKKIPDIIKEVFRKAGFTDFREALTGNYTEWEFCVQYRETDLNFVSRLMEHDGIYYFFEHANGKHTLVLADAPSAHKPKEGLETIVFRANPDGLRDKDYIHEFIVEREVLPGASALNDFNFEKPRTSLKGRSEISQEYPNSNFEIYDYPGEYEQPPEGTAYARLRIEELQAQQELARGQSTDRAIVAGTTFTLAEFPRKDWNKNYLCTAVSIQVTSDGFESGADGGGGEFYACSFAAIPAETQFRAPRLTPKPLIEGPQTAIVTGPAGQEIYVDKYGRVKLQFHWDREGKFDENSSCWVRVSQAWTGKGWGHIANPHMQEEVIVDFLEGDPDRPIVVGRVYNADHMPPYALPAAAAIIGMKTTSTKTTSIYGVGAKS